VDLFQTLRRVQRKERENGTLAKVEETFYNDIHKYLNELRQSAIDNPFSDVYNTLNEAIRIATEICERREHKITNAAVLNMNRSYQLFSQKQEFDLVDSMPLNLTPEEETFYFSLIDTLKNHRINLSTKDILKPPKAGENHSSKNVERKTKQEKDVGKDQSAKSITAKASDSLSGEDEPDDEVISRLDEISKAKVITDEVRQPIEKQISKKSGEVKSKKSLQGIDVIGDIDEVNKDENQFIDLESQSRIKDSEIVTMLIFDNIDSIVGIDEKIYGPFRPQDVVTLPRINANIFAKSRKGRFVKI